MLNKFFLYLKIFKLKHLNTDDAVLIALTTMEDLKSLVCRTNKVCMKNELIMILSKLKVMVLNVMVVISFDIRVYNSNSSTQF